MPAGAGQLDVGQSRGPPEGAWKLGCGAALGLATFVAILVVTGVVTSVVHVDELRRSERLAPSKIRLLVALYFFRIAAVSIAAFGIACYVAVSSRAPRPRQLHLHGLTLVLGLIFNVWVIFPEITDRTGHSLASWMGSALNYVFWGCYKAIFYKVMINKMMVLGPPASRCQDLRLWGNLMLASVVITTFLGFTSWIIAVSFLLRGAEADAVLGAGQRFPPDESQMTVAEWIVYAICVNFAGVAICGYLVTATAFLWAARRVMSRVIAALIARGIAERSLAEVRSTLGQHFLGLVLSLSTTMAQFLISMADSTNALAQEAAEDLVGAAVSLIDCGGDVAGILLLSGIGTLMWREDPNAGDVNKQIRDLLHAAVLTGRGDLTFEGNVTVTPSRRCIASFPGKYLQEWKALTWLCERRELSSACVFLPLSDPQQRFGEHTLCDETPGKCWCSQLYGERKEWGCRWFEAWRSNIDKAVAMGLDLVVVFFPGQVDQGVVGWKDLSAHGDALWNGDGLGGSQKAEAAYLLREGIKFTSEDLIAFRSGLTRQPPSRP